MFVAAYHSPELPWTIPEDEERRYRKILKRILVAFLVFALITPWLPVPKIARERVEELPPRLAKLLLERPLPPPPAPIAKAPEPELKKPEPKPAEPKKVEPKKVEPMKNVEAARAKAERSGLLAFKDDLADLRANTATTKFAKDPTAVPGPTKGAGSGGPARTADRALITSSALGGSGGVNTAKLSRDTGGGGLAGRATTTVASPVGDGNAAGGTLRRGAGGKSSRSVEDIKLVFDRNKGSIYTLYNRALREDPTLQGKLVVKLTIAPSGQVVDCQLVSSELRAPELERKLLARIRQFDFGSKSVEEMVVTYPIDFLPS